jgi:uncharacterized phage protein (TIGR01671 family)
MEQREIKFRAYAKSLKRMYQLRGFEQGEGCITLYFQNGGFGTYRDDDVVMMPFVGLRANDGGHEIYCGDIVEAIGDTQSGRMKKFIGVVENRGVDGYTIEKGKEWFELGLKRYDYKVLGNIYENPDLMREGERGGER